MANLKISALPAATTPLAGTEVLPIVQSGVTDQVTVANLTAGRAISAATITSTGVTSALVFTGNNNGTYPTQQAGGAISYNASGGFSEVDFWNTGTGTPNYAFSWYQQTGASSKTTLMTLSSTALRLPSGNFSSKGITTDNGSTALGFGTNNGITSMTLDTGGSLAFNTAAKGIDFSANTPAAGKTSTLLNWYEEGTWTPTIVGSVVAGTQTYIWRKGSYTRIGNRVIIDFELLVTKDATTSGDISITGLPFTANSNGGVPLGFAVAVQNGVTFAGGDNTLVVNIRQGTTIFNLSTYPVSTNNLTAAALASGFRILGTTQYFI